jgi:hypothetical protein
MIDEGVHRRASTTLKISQAARLLNTTVPELAKLGQASMTLTLGTARAGTESGCVPKLVFLLRALTLTPPTKFVRDACPQSDQRVPAQFRSTCHLSHSSRPSQPPPRHHPLTAHPPTTIPSIDHISMMLTLQAPETSGTGSAENTDTGAGNASRCGQHCCCCRCRQMQDAQGHLRRRDSVQAALTGGSRSTVLPAVRTMVPAFDCVIAPAPFDRLHAGASPAAGGCRHDAV